MTEKPSHVKIITDKIKQSPEGNIFVSKVTAEAGALPHTNMMNFFVNCNREFMSLREAYSSLQEYGYNISFPSDGNR